MAYLERFWTQYEAWLSFMRPSANGLSSATGLDLRCTIVTLRGIPESFKNALKEEWSKCNSSQAAVKLSQEYVTVTNKSDKDVQLQKIAQFDAQVRAVMANQHAAELEEAKRAQQRAERRRVTDMLR